MIVYLTFAESPSGIYSSQVIDTCSFLSELSGQRVKLISIISTRNFFVNRRVIRTQYPNSIVLPMVPKLKNWKLNIWLLGFILFFLRPSMTICRNSFGTVFALKLRALGILKTVVYDGRGCEYEQAKEYQVVTDPVLMEQMLVNERRSANETDFQMAVSVELLNYWINKFGYERKSNVVIPCTLNRSFEHSINPDISRASLGFQNEDVVMVYSGSVSGWQSFRLLFDFIEMHLESNGRIRILLLTMATPEIREFAEKHKDKVRLVWSAEKDVNSYLSLADYGLLIRETTVTNWVASPIKFAEYLYAGLDVIVNEKSIEQVINFVDKNNCGFVFQGKVLPLEKLDPEKKKNNSRLALNNFSKKSELLIQKYKLILKEC